MTIHSKQTVCRLCGSTHLKCVLPMQPIPIGEHYSEIPCSDSQRYPIDIYFCENCTAVQTLDNIDPDYLWKDYTYFSGQTKKIIEHFQEFASSISHYFKESDSVNTLDIGSNDGSLLEQFKKLGHRVTGVDPAITVVEAAREKGINTIHSLFGIDTAQKHVEKHSFDLITAFNVFAHSEDMHSMLSGVDYCLSDNGIFCFEVQYLADIVNKNILGTFFHEHMIHYSCKSASLFIKNIGLEIIDYQRNNIQNGSIIFICARKGSSMAKNNANPSRMKNIYDSEKELGFDNAAWSQKLIESNFKIKSSFQSSSQEIKSLVGYGAARSGPTLAIQYGLDGYITKIFDDHPSKVGKFSPYHGIKIYETSDLNPKLHPACVVLAYIHYKAIIKSNIEYLRGGGKFILLWPDYSEVNYENYADFIS